MSEARTSNVTMEATTQGASGIQTSSVAGEVVNRTTDQSPIQTSSVIGEVLNRTSVESTAQTTNVVMEVMCLVNKRSERLFPVHQRRFK